MKTFLLVPVVVAIAGCSVAAKPIPDSQPHASLHFGPAPGVAGISAFWFEDQHCNTGQYSGKVGALSWLTGRERQITIPADRPIYVTQKMATGAGGPPPTSCAPNHACITVSTCTSMVKFTPEAGKSYNAELIATPERCATVMYENTDSGEVLVKDQEEMPALCELEK